MAHRYDVSLKALFMNEGDGIMRRRLFGGRVVQHLGTEQPVVSNRRADMVVRTEDGSIQHVEFQASHEPGFGVRMLRYYAYLVETYEVHARQTVLYLGREPLRLERGYQSPSIDFRYGIVNLRELDAGPLLASPDWADVALGLLAKGDREEALSVAVSRLREMGSAEREWASGTLVLLSGILGIEATVSERMKDTGMINAMENKVLAPLILEAERKGRQEGMNQLLLNLLTDKYGELPGWVSERLQGASPEQLYAWAKRVVQGLSLEETLR